MGGLAKRGVRPQAKPKWKGEVARRKSVTVKRVSGREKIGNDWLGRAADGEEQQSHSSKCGGTCLKLVISNY